MSANVLRLLAPAKINLHLRIGPVRGDGFHPLLSWMTTVGLFDSLSLTSPHEGGPFDSSFAVAAVGHRAGDIVLSCDDPTLPCDGRNLVIKAATLFNQHLAAASQGKAAGVNPDAFGPSSSGRNVSVHLEKRIPAGGGLGGGSSDAARTLLGLNRLWANGPNQMAVDDVCLSELGLSLGSDVPFFLFGPSSVCKGRGEAVRPIGVPTGGKWVTLVLPPIGMPTGDVYRRFDEMGLGERRNLEEEPNWDEWISLDSTTLMSRLVNDLEAPAFALRPELGALRHHLEKTVGRAVRMSGSGSSLFTLFDGREEAIAAAQKIKTTHGVRAIAIELAPDVIDDLTD
jgi:4-diphosphocytidyl-2-C-methyl-D-erythritol kinase